MQKTTEELSGERLAQIDYLTGLDNRRGLYDYYARLEAGTFLHAMFLDVDNFKRVNDIYGHSMGDELLICIAHLIQTHTDGFSSRIGGDEFVVLFPAEESQEHLEEMAEHLLEGMHDLDFRKDILSLTSLSIGLVLNQPTTSSLDDILYKCDAAMYQAKYNGKGRLAIYHSNDKMAEINRNIELEMEQALKNGEFQVFFQPKVNMVTTQLYGAEALSRWIHPTEGLRMPSLYIGLFEKNGFISRLDMYIFEETCRIKHSWRGKKYEHIPVSVNMSRLHLFNEAFPLELKAIADRYQIPTGELEIEITEGVFIKDNAEMIRMVGLLQEQGFLVSIDDFGSGFSALNLLKDLQVDTIKLDREFLRLSSDSYRGKKVIRNIIAMCRDLKMDVVTEGIETKEQIDFIMSCGCQIAQGFYYSRPISVSAFQTFAEEYMTNPLEYFSFRLNGDLKSEDGSKEGAFRGEGFSYGPGIFRNSKSLYFPGGPTEQNVVILPNETIVNDSLTISMWIRPKKNHTWTSALYLKYETGFLTICPLATEGNSDLRIRDSKEVSGWYDLPALQLREGVWFHYVATYNAKAERAVAFINGEVVFSMENVPTNRAVKLILLGGDVFQPSFNGNLCEVRIYNECKDYDFISRLHDEYRYAEDFCAFEIGEEDK
ncbi:MAG: EAL domain-containing protein [Lachnospiraceae bacterium]|nr:EAL domain-containing protein [Lachnospiraceae bacterium]